jgi:hypothetical protein
MMPQYVLIENNFLYNKFKIKHCPNRFGVVEPENSWCGVPSIRKNKLEVTDPSSD